VGKKAVEMPDTAGNYQLRFVMGQAKSPPSRRLLEQRPVIMQNPAVYTRINT
jgi:hypothetical protein